MPDQCPGSDLTPAETGHQVAIHNTLCLLNAVRAENGLRPLKLDRRLHVAAWRHSNDMVVNRYFSHDSLSGASVVRRIARTGWMRRKRRGWIVGENLAWGSGMSASPVAAVINWMNSPAHRKNILFFGYRTVGIGLADGVPLPDIGTGATYTTDFGGRT